MKYMFKQIDNISGSNTVTTIDFESDALQVIIERFQDFLKGSGFVLNGVLDIIPDEEYYGYESGDKYYGYESGDTDEQPLWHANDGYADLAKVWVDSAGTVPVPNPQTEYEHSVHYFDTMRNK